MASIVNPVVAAQNPNWAALIPGRNPTGTTTTGGNSIPAIGSSSGQNPLLPTSNVPSGAPATNSYDPTSVIPTFGANSGAYSPASLLPTSASTGQTGPISNYAQAQQSGIGGINNMTSTDIGRLFNSLKGTFGDGTAHAILDFLTSGAGFNQQAVDNLFAALQPGYERAQENLMQQFSTSGNRFGSGAQIGLADLMSQEQLNMGQIETQMYEQSINDYINTLLSVSDKNAQRYASSPGLMGTLSSAIPLISGAAGAASAAGVGGTAGTILDIIAGMG